ncbi:hypothetical protein GLOIN_2v1790435 [Rhizophagus irregularis DAOM 181602=DAOM 197198]|uniref:Uncharacterized protein n=1 Tax=Rhizophagus irregularis (strain DAOM 181602 / DAOM 197198 / MUCL 43194) TaxID=747089 RepID=A0A2P4NZ65_RHIID|nr:hypothetical protein GLOIN_2v1790435 [Rhizophagus irregularis DAOM 181602=DAOM 197198]POG58407.1 hypothetical protein GLOIN_2v1790435 [Rhizophagus irregularis DAOM 181602=DAOM 197198]|eukprot:XP_025165273.1 hypothetical protein GLOIN_2v1790435 [Rhizophagus irregularis DAOM 181602=DAOM 197198]
MSDTLDTLASASISTTGNAMLAEEIKKYKTEEIVNFLSKQEDLENNSQAKVNVCDFLKTSMERFLSYGIPGGLLRDSQTLPSSNRNGPYLRTHFEVVGEENTGHVDYEIKAFERFILSWKGNHMRWDLNLIQCESALQINKTDNDFKDEFDYIYGRHTAWRVCLEKGFGEKKYW